MDALEPAELPQTVFLLKSVLLSVLTDTAGTWKGMGRSVLPTSEAWPSVC